MKEKKKLNTVRKIEYKRKESFFLIIRGIEVGVSAGLICVLYRFLLEYAEKYLYSLLDIIKGSPVKITIWLIALSIIGAVVALIIKIEPMASGSGIPQVTGEVKGVLTQSWYKVLLAKIFGGTASVFSGLSLGREGPSVQLGGMAAKGVAQITGADKTTQLRMISCGAGAGMAAAFNAPLAGTMFVLEEIHHSLDKNILCMGIVASITADYVSKIFFGQSTIFSYETVNFPLSYYWLLILMGIICGLCGVFYNVIMLKLQKLYNSIKSVEQYIKLPLVFVISGIVGLLLPQVSCGGHSMVEYLMDERPELGVMVLLLAAKFLFGALCFSSGAPGGTLYPLCILGTYIGAIFAEVSTQLLPIESDLWEEFVVIGMAGLFSSIVRAPITGIILVFELTGNMNNLLPLATVALISYATANLIGIQPFYEALLSNMSVSDGEKPKLFKRSEKIIKSFVIPLGSKLDNKKIKEIDWGRHALIVTVERDGESITPNGELTLKSGDEIVFLISQRRYEADIKRFESLFATE